MDDSEGGFVNGDEVELSAMNGEWKNRTDSAAVRWDNLLSEHKVPDIVWRGLNVKWLCRVPNLY